jgi:hypothetical protein
MKSSSPVWIAASPSYLAALAHEDADGFAFSGIKHLANEAKPSFAAWTNRELFIQMHG